MASNPMVEQAFASAMDRLARGDLASARALRAGLASQAHPLLDYLDGLIWLAGGNPALARPSLEQAMLGLNGHDALQADLVLCLVQCGDLQTARSRSDAALAMSPGFAGHAYARGLLELQSSDFAEAADRFRQATKLAPHDIRAWMLLGQCCHALGLHADAVQAFRNGLQREPGNPHLVLSLAAVLLDEGDYPSALAHATQATRLQPGLANSWTLHSRALFGLRRYGEAEASASRALSLDATDAQALQARGLARQARGMSEQAAADFSLAMSRTYAPGVPRGSQRREFRQTTRAKLRHDIEQFRHLARETGEIRFEQLAASHESLLSSLAVTERDDAFIDIPADLLGRFDGSYNRLHHLAPAPRLAGGALHPGFDGAAVEADYAGRAPGITWIDDFLSPEALATLRTYCLQSTFWFDFHHPNGYLGAAFKDGFAAPLLLQLAEELGHKLPNIVGGHALSQLWAFKYDSRLEGIKLHADVAAVNLNFWITPDEANLDPDSGGLVLWDKEAPVEWGFDEYNASSPAGQARIEAYLRDSGAKMIRVPYRQNRAVLFNSDLFHATDTIRFKDGYENRRINITLLFGLREGVVK